MAIYKPVSPKKEDPRHCEQCGQPLMEHEFYLCLPCQMIEEELANDERDTRESILASLHF